MIKFAFINTIALKTSLNFSHKWESKFVVKTEAPGPCHHSQGKNSSPWIAPKTVQAVLNSKTSPHRAQSSLLWTNSKYAGPSVPTSKRRIQQPFRPEQNKTKICLKMRQISNWLRTHRTTLKQCSTTATWACRTTKVGSSIIAPRSRERHQTPCSFWNRAITTWLVTPQPYANKRKASRLRLLLNKRLWAFSLNLGPRTRSRRSFSSTRSSKSMQICSKTLKN